MLIFLQNFAVIFKNEEQLWHDLANLRLLRRGSAPCDASDQRNKSQASHAEVLLAPVSSYGSLWLREYVKTERQQTIIRTAASCETVPCHQSFSRISYCFGLLSGGGGTKGN